MKLGFIGAGNMASALALGWNEPALVADIDREKAEKLAAAIGGTVAADNAELAERADVVVLCHKPGQLEDVAASTQGKAEAVVSILAGVDVAALEAAYPDAPVYRVMPNLAAQVHRGTFCYVAGTRAAGGPEEEILDLFGRLGTVVPLQESQMLIATAVMSCSPAWLSLAAEALVDAGVKHGLERADAERLVAEAVVGTGALLADGGHSAGEVQLRIASPGGLTKKGLESLEENGVRSAFAAAVEKVMGS